MIYIADIETRWSSVLYICCFISPKLLSMMFIYFTCLRYAMCVID